MIGTTAAIFDDRCAPLTALLRRELPLSALRAPGRTLAGLARRAGTGRAAAGAGRANIQPPYFEGLAIPLEEARILWQH